MKTDNIPLTEPQILSCIDYVSNKLAPQFTFGYYGVEDVKQEIRIFCLEALPKYRIDKGKLSTFLMVCATRKLINFRRNNLFRMPPECDCESCRHGVECERQAKRMKKWKKLNTVKRNLMNINHIGDDDYEEDIRTNFAEFNELINAQLDIHLREDYVKMRDGVKLPRKKYERIVAELRSILEKHDG